MIAVELKAINFTKSNSIDCGYTTEKQQLNACNTDRLGVVQCSATGYKNYKNSNAIESSS